MELVYFKNNQLTLLYHPKRQMVRALWGDLLRGEAFRTCTLRCLQLLEERTPIFWLADNRKLKAIGQQDQDWFEKEIFPRLAASSLEKMATLVSEDIFNQLAVEALHTRGSALVRFETRFFLTEELALQWFDTLPEDDTLIP